MPARSFATPRPCYLPSVYDRVSETDRELVRRLLTGFVPPNAFDIHAHLFTVEGLHVPAVPAAERDSRATLDAYRDSLRAWLGDEAPEHGLFFAFPTSPTMEAAGENAFVADQVAQEPGSGMLWLVRPTDDPAEVEKAVVGRHVHGFKVYHLLSSSGDTFAAPVSAYLPEWMWELAQRHGLVIMLHLVRRRALSDPENSSYVRDHCLRYPDVRLVLAHAGRGFCARHTVAGIEALRGLDNVFFDTAALCEPSPLEAVLRVFGPSRLLFGTDWPVSNLRGKCVSLADGFFWLYDHNADWSESRFGQPTLVGIESLLALQQAARTACLTDGDLERVFRDNARDLLQLPAPGEEQAARSSGDHSQRVVTSNRRTQALYETAKKLLPGGTQLLSKRPEQFAPGVWPAYFREARGCEVIDLDGRRFLDLAFMGIGACLLGYNDPDVTAAVSRRVALGSMSTLNCPEEVELAQLLLELHPWAEQVRYLRTGGEAMAAAVRIARAATGRDKVALCGYHGWHDWYLAANLPAESAGPAEDRLRDHLLPGLEPAGVPSGLTGTVFPFHYNRPEELEAIVEAHGDDLAAVVMEPTRGADPAPGFLETVRQLCSRCGAKLVIDEITIGFRLCRGGAHLKYGLIPDLAVFAKALGNGYPMAAIIGAADTMEACQRTFISSTYWTEGIGPAAAVATLRKLKRIDAPTHIAALGRKMRQGWEELARRYQVPLHTTGHDALVKLGFDHPDDLALQTLLTVRMLEQGFLACAAFYPSMAHESRHVDAYLAAAEPVFAELGEAVRAGDACDRVGGAVRQSGFARLA